MAEGKRSYNMGHRKGHKDFSKNNGQLTDNKLAFVNVFFGQFVIWADFVNDDEGNPTDEILDIKLMHPMPRRPAIAWNLTALTEDELIAFKHLLDTAFEWALPYVKHRDKEAQDAYENGDDSFSRIYRQVPKLVYRPGAKPEYRESVQHGPENADASSPDDRDLDDGLRDDGPEVAERDSNDSGPEDNRPKVDKSPRLR